MICFKKITTLQLIILLSACANTQVDLKSTVDVPEQFEQVDAQTAIDDLDQWWLAWNDSQLTSLIQQALTNNKDLAKTKAKLEEAKAHANLATADKGPQVGLSVDTLFHKEHYKNPLPSEARNALSITNSSWSDRWKNNSGHLLGAGIAASWEPDFFGAKQADADAAAYGAVAKAEEWHAAQMLLSTEIADKYYQRQYYFEKKALINQQIQNLSRLTKYIQGRFEAGQTTYYNQLELQGQLEALIASKQTLDAQADHLKRELAVLVGVTPQNFDLPVSNKLMDQHLPKPPQGQTPANVLNRRPDIRALEAQVYARSAQLASAKADLLPRFKLNFLAQTGQVELSSDGPTIKGAAGLLGLGFDLPIFTSGRIQRNIDAKDANLEAALNEYDHAVLEALAEVDSMYQIQTALNKQHQQLNKAISTHKKKTNAAQKLFNYGEKTFDTLIESKTDLLTLQQDTLDLRLKKIQTQLNLYKTLGGGWQAESL